MEAELAEFAQLRAVSVYSFRFAQAGAETRFGERAQAEREIGRFGEAMSAEQALLTFRCRAAILERQARNRSPPRYAPGLAQHAIRIRPKLRESRARRRSQSLRDGGDVGVELDQTRGDRRQATRMMTRRIRPARD